MFVAVRCATLFIVTLLFGSVRSCPNGYQDKGLSASAPTRRICIHVTSGLYNYCSAQAFCRTIKGELLTGKEEIQLLAKDSIFVGMTDLLEEKFTNKNGWRWNNGEIAPSDIFSRKVDS